MKKCPYCSENIQDEAIKCRFCGEWLTQSTQEPANTKFENIKLIGVGGSGNNSLNKIIELGIENSIETLSIDTDKNNLSTSNAKTCIDIGKNITSGLGTNANPEVGKQAAQESNQAIKNSLSNAAIAIVVCGIGGGTGGGASSVIAEIGKNLEVLTIGIFIKPFSFEGQARMELANTALESAKKHFDIIFLYENNKVLSKIDGSTSIQDAYYLIDEGILLLINLIKDYGSEKIRNLAKEKEIIDIDLVPFNKAEISKIFK